MNNVRQNKYPLAVAVPTLGVRTETFIHRHICHLLPEQTAVITIGRSQSIGEFEWPECMPILDLTQIASLQNGLQHSHAQAIKNLLQRHGCEVVLGQFLHSAVHLIPIVQEMGCRFVGHAHGYDVSVALRDQSVLESYLAYNDTEGIATMSKYSKRRLENIGINSQKVQVIPYGTCVGEKPILRSASGGVRFVAVGRFVGKKAPILTIEAFRIAANKIPNLSLEYIGEGPLFEAAEEFIKSKGISDKVKLLGPKSHCETLLALQEADVYIQHSIVDPSTGDEEGLPVAILEAMSLSLPVVATRHAGIPEAVTHGDTGYLVDEEDVDGMARAMMALAKSPQLRRSLGMGGWKKAKSNFTWERERNTLLKLLGLSDIV